MPGGDGGTRRAARHADRRRQVALLPAPRPRPRRHDARRDPAHRPDGRSGPEAQGAGPPRRAHPLGAGATRIAEPCAATSSTVSSTSSSSPPSGFGSRLPRDARAAPARSRGGGRGALHLGVGPRLQARLPPARRAPARAAARPDHRAHGDGDAARAGRRRRAARPPGSAASSTASAGRTSPSRRRSDAGPARGLAALALLGDAARRPAMVYAPTRQGAEELAASLQPGPPRGGLPRRNGRSGPRSACRRPSSRARSR